jgi:predicted nucleic-acid-binding protein
MIGLDTNCLIRYLIEDDAKQAKTIAARLVQGFDDGEVFLINQIVLCEVVWVLTRLYRVPKAGIVDALEKVMGADQFEIEAKGLALQALSDYKTTAADFADCLIAQKNRASGCTKTLTFDKRAKALQHYEVLNG